MENSKTTRGGYRPAADRFAIAVYTVAGFLAFAELLALFWLDLI